MGVGFVGQEQVVIGRGFDARGQIAAREAVAGGQQGEVSIGTTAAAALASHVQVCAFEHLWQPRPAQGAGGTPVSRVDGLVLFELEQEGIEGLEVVGGRAGVEVEDGGEAEAKQEVVGCAAGLVADGEGGEAGEVGFGEEERVEPVDASFVAARGGGLARERAG